jgi:hypothetical protein
MLHDLKIDELLDKVDSRYGLAVAFRQPVEDTDEEIGAADADDFISPPAGTGVPQEMDIDSGAPGDEGAA